MKNKDRAPNYSHKKKIAENEALSARLLKCALKSMAISFFVAVIFIFLGCLAAYFTNDPTSLSPIISLFSLFASFFACGFIASRLCRGMPFLSGITAGGMYVILVLCISLFIKLISKGDALTKINPLVYALTIPTAILGSFLGNIRITKRKRLPSSRIKKKR